MRPLAVRDKLSTDVPLIAPSMLKCDFGNLHREIALLESAGADMLHLDVMDGHFVPNLTYGPAVIERLRALTALPFDAHLMISEPGRYLDEFLKAGCDAITIHIEAVPEPTSLLQRIRSADAAAGLALNPGTPADAMTPYLRHCDLVLVMTVEPGFGGQEFIAATIEKLRQLADTVPPGTLLSVDGGIGRTTIVQVAEAGANVFVAGSAIFEANDYSQAIAELRDLASDVRGLHANSISSSCS